MTKKYKCRLSASSLLVNLKGNVIRLEFDADVISIYGMRGCSYSTDNKEIQRAIERSKRFNNHRQDEVWTDDVEPAQEVKAEAPTMVVSEEKPQRAKVARRYKGKKEE